MAVLVEDLEHQAWCYESELGRELIVETSGVSYGSRRVFDKVQDVTGMTLGQLGTRYQTMVPSFKLLTG